MLLKSRVDLLIEFGLGGVFLTTKVDVDVAAYVLSKNVQRITVEESFFMNLQKYKGLKIKQSIFQNAFDDFLAGVRNEHNYNIIQSKLKIIESWPFIYWISDELREKFKLESVEDLLKNCQGLATANNNKFLRFWWELGLNDKKINAQKWVYYAKGGPYKKWFGNLWLMVNWESDGYEIKNYIDDKGKQKSRPQNESVYFKEGVTYSASGSKGPSYRLLPSGCIFDVGGSSIFPINKYRNNNYILAFFNSSFSNYITDCLNPTVNKQVGDIGRVPFVIPKGKEESIISSLSKTNVEITKKICSSILYEGEFKESPLSNSKVNDWRFSILNILNFETHIQTQVLINEAIINDTIFKVYELTEHDKKMVVEKEGESVGNLPVSPEAMEAYLASNVIDFPLDQICDFIRSLPVKEYSADQWAVIGSEISFLYQSNNDLEDFCIRHQVNPINVWYLLTQSNVIPEQLMRTLALEFLIFIIREILMEDEDGIVPLAAGSGEKTLIERIENKFREKGFSNAQYSTFDSVLGRPLDEYINRYFFAALSEYLNLFRHLPMTPYIWQLSSGPEQGFDCYIIIYKWSRDKLMRIRSEYIERRERSLTNRQSDLASNESAEAQNQKDRIFKQLQEIETFKKKIDELLSEGYTPILDDGVGKNIAPLQKKGMIPYEVLNPGQLEKYLHADW